MEGRALKVSTGIFLFAIFVFLGVFVGGWMYNLYTEQTSYSKQESTSIVGCATITFDVSDAQYEAGVLSFVIENKPGDPLEKVGVSSGDEDVIIDTPLLAGGSSQLIEVEMALGGDVLVYPVGCKEHNVKRFRIS